MLECKMGLRSCRLGVHALPVAVDTQGAHANGCRSGRHNVTLEGLMLQHGGHVRLQYLAQARWS